MVKNSQFWAFFGVFEWLNLFRLNFALAEKLYFLPFLEIMMVGKLKSPAIARHKIFCVKNVDFLPNHQVFLVKMYLKSNIRHTIDWNCFEILNSHLCFITWMKRSNIQCEIWNCPLYPCFQCTVPPTPHWTKITLGLTCDDFTLSLGPLKAEIHAFSDGLSENEWKSQNERVHKFYSSALVFAGTVNFFFSTLRKLTGAYSDQRDTPGHTWNTPKK